MAWFFRAMEVCPFSLCLSGGIAVAGDLERVLGDGPRPAAVMLGRGLVADPALAQKLRGGPGADRETLRQFVEELFQETASALGSPRSTMFRMKELWSYMILLFGDREALWRQLRKSTSLTEYQAAVARIFRDLPLLEAAEVNWR